MSRYKSAIIFLLMNCCAFLCAQNPQYSRDFKAAKNHVPIRIINASADFFYVLRYNKEVHDFTVERRAKPDCRIVAFTPLKLDSVNASWFNYENLDYVVHSIGQKLYFIFEKVTNTQRVVYLKQVDSSGKASGFRELAKLDGDEATSEFHFEIKITGHNKLLVVGRQAYVNHTAKVVAMLYDLEEGRSVWMKKLPIENGSTGFSEVYECNAGNDLFYTLHRSRLYGYKRKYINNAQQSIPVYTYDSIVLAGYLCNAKSVIKKGVSYRDSIGVNSISIFARDSVVTIAVQGYRQNEQHFGQPYYLSRSFTSDLGTELAAAMEPMDTGIQKKLTFYDGTDYKEAWDKSHTVTRTFASGNRAYVLAGREEENYAKELLLWRINTSNCHIESQCLVPRKIFFFNDRIRFRYIGSVTPMLLNGTFYAFVLEDGDNRLKSPEDFSFQRFSRQKYLWGAYMAAYILRPNGSFEKKIVPNSVKMNFVPLPYQGGAEDVVFYLYKGGREKFAILKPDLF